MGSWGSLELTILLPHPPEHWDYEYTATLRAKSPLSLFSCLFG